MISREEAHRLDRFSPHYRRAAISSSSVYSLVEAIYDSIGSCGTCKKWAKYKGLDLGECGKTSMDEPPSFFCADFEKKT